MTTIPTGIPAEAATLLDLMRTARAMRWFRPEPVPDEVIEQIVTAATYAPSGKNTQPWAFVAIRDPELRRQVGALYRAAWYEAMPPLLAAPPADAAEARARRHWQHTADHMGEAPLLMLVCYASDTPTTAPGGSIFPAIQNLLLAARAFGVGGTLTTVHRNREPAIKALIGIPDRYDTVALIPMGYPARDFAPVRRRPVGEVLHWDGWQSPV
jgi:nitroreductase